MDIAPVRIRIQVEIGPFTDHNLRIAALGARCQAEERLGWNPDPIATKESLVVEFKSFTERMLHDGTLRSVYAFDAWLEKIEGTPGE